MKQEILSNFTPFHVKKHKVAILNNLINKIIFISGNDVLIIV